MPDRLVRVNFVLEETAKTELETLAAGWKVSVAAVLREAAHAFLRDPHPPTGTTSPGRKPGVDPELALALHRLHEAGAQPSQLSQTKVSAIRRDDALRVLLDLPHVGRFKDRSIVLSTFANADSALRGAVGLLVCWHRNPADVHLDAPLLVNGNGEPWPATKIARAMKRGKKLAETQDQEEPTDDQNDHSAELDRE